MSIQAYSTTDNVKQMKINQLNHFQCRQLMKNIGRTNLTLKTTLWT